MDATGYRVCLQNKYLVTQGDDILYHIGYSTNDDLEALFGDVKFVCMGGSASRMKVFAEFMQKELTGEQEELKDLCSTDRYSMYKVGPLLAVNHGIGMPSLSVLLHELIKLLYHAHCKDVVMMRIGTSGGVGVCPGTVVVTETAVNEMLEPTYNLAILGKIVSRPTGMDNDLVNALLSCQEENDTFDVVKGNTISTSDFFEGQGRLDGAICEHSEEEKMAYLTKAYKQGVRNIEMESTCFAAMCNKVGIPGAIVCVTLLNRLLGDQVTSTKSQLKQLETYPQQVVSRYIKKQLKLM